MSLTTRRSDYYPTAPNLPDVFPTGKLMVTVAKARGIRSDESLGLGRADPYAMVTLGGNEYGRTGLTFTDTGIFELPFNTDHAERIEERREISSFSISTAEIVANDAGGEPVWNYTFDFHVKCYHEEHNDLRIKIYNQNHWPRKDNILGAISMRNMCRFLTTHNYAVQAAWYPIFYKGSIRGQICLSLCFIPMSPAKVLAETHILYGDADDRGGARDVRDIRDSHHSPIIDWQNMGQLLSLGLGAAQVVVGALAL